MLAQQARRTRLSTVAFGFLFSAWITCFAGSLSLCYGELNIFSSMIHDSNCETFVNSKMEVLEQYRAAFESRKWFLKFVVTMHNSVIASKSYASSLESRGGNATSNNGRQGREKPTCQEIPMKLQYLKHDLVRRRTGCNLQWYGQSCPASAYLRLTVAPK